MKTVINLRNLAVLTLVLITVNAFSWSDPIDKSYKAEYNVNKDATLIISNKYGQIKCQNWDKNVVSIEVTVTVEARNESKAQRYLDWIEVSLSGNKDKVEGITRIKEGSSFNNVELNIDYMIMMPRTLTIDFTNKFGEIVMEENEGPAKIEIAYGDLDISALNHKNNSLEIKFSEADLGYFHEGEINMSYSELEIDGAVKIDLDTKFSEIDIEKVDMLNVDSQYDDYTLERVGPIAMEAKFSDAEIEVQNGTFEYDFQYGELSVDEVQSVKGRCEIYNSFADVSLTFGPGVAFTIDAETKYGELSYPKVFNINHREEGYTTHVYSGTVGEGAGSSDLLYIRAKNASVYLR